MHHRRQRERARVNKAIDATVGNHVKLADSESIAPNRIPVVVNAKYSIVAIASVRPIIRVAEVAGAPNHSNRRLPFHAGNQGRIPRVVEGLVANLPLPLTASVACVEDDRSLVDVFIAT